MVLLGTIIHLSLVHEVFLPQEKMEELQQALAQKDVERDTVTEGNTSSVVSHHNHKLVLT